MKILRKNTDPRALTIGSTPAALPNSSRVDLKSDSKV